MKYLIEKVWGPVFSVIILAAVSASAASEGLPDSPDLVVERAVSRAVGAAGGVDGVGSVAEIDGLPDDPGARRLADLLLQRIRGDDEAAQLVVLDALDSAKEGRRRSYLASMLNLLPASGVAPGLRMSVARGAAPVHQAAHAVFLAREGQCDQAKDAVSDLPADASRESSIAILIARTYADCGAYAEALRVLQPFARGLDSLRVQLLAGRSLLAIGDYASASHWCGEVAKKSRGLPTLLHPAKRCVAAADALRGIMPRGRLEYIEACRDEMLDPSAFRQSRIDAGLSAVWVTLSGRVAGASRRVLNLLTELERIDVFSSSRTAGEMLALLSQAGLDIAPPKSRIMAAAEIPAAGSPVPTLALMVESLRAHLAADDPGASVAMARAEEAARTFGAFELLAAVHHERARMARREGNDSLARIHVREALEAWLESGFPFSRTPFVDPGLPRTLLETAIEIDLQGAEFSGAATGELLPQIEYEKRLMSDGRVDRQSIPALAELRQQLASVDGTLIYYVIGQSKTFAWRIEPTGSHGMVLPAGDRLFDAVDEGRIADEILGTLVGGLPKDRILIVSPDGFLGGLPWRDLETPTVLSAFGGALGTKTLLTIVPSLRKFINVSIGQITPKGAAKVLIMADRRPGFADEPGDHWLDRLSLNRPPEFSFIEFSTKNKSRVQGAAHRDHSVLHLRVPLLASGRGDEGLIIGLYDRESGAARIGGQLGLHELLGPSIGGALIALDASGGWVVGPESLAAAAARLVDHGAFGAVVPLAAGPPESRDSFWARFYVGLNEGDEVLEALASAVESTRANETVASFDPSINFTGSVDLRLAEDRRLILAFWIPLGLGAAILIVTLLIATRKKKDPFDIEPPEEV